MLSRTLKAMQSGSYTGSNKKIYFRKKGIYLADKGN